MDLPKLQTTITGSLPKPAWLCEPLQLWSPWRLEGDVLKEGQQDAVRLVLRDQEKAGIETLEQAAAGLPCKTAVHICYGYGIKQNTDWKKTLGQAWRRCENCKRRDRLVSR